MIMPLSRQRFAQRLERGRDCFHPLEQMGKNPRRMPLQSYLRRPSLAYQHPIGTTGPVVTGGQKSRIHPATRTFQAIRIAVNQELSVLEKGINLAITQLCAGGKIAVISFHSLRRSIVKTSQTRIECTASAPPNSQYALASIKPV
jgi:hypothetical protein